MQTNTSQASSELTENDIKQYQKNLQDSIKLLNNFLELAKIQIKNQ
ncbi:MAG: hypothetical protein WCW27_03090 [Patescibacteria group bacterium]|jgi:hypothetical protein